MGREFELKYRATEAQFAALKADFPDLHPIAMETTYYDTFDGKMGNYHWTFRRRMENGKSVCALKTPGEDGGTGEWEVEESDIQKAIPRLCALGAPEDLLTMTQKGVIPICGARFTRLAGLIDAPGCTVELALDEGWLLGGGKEQPLCEIEVELKSGDEAAAVAFAQELAQRFGLVPQPKSKYRRALELARD